MILNNKHYTIHATHQENDVIANVSIKDGISTKAACHNIVHQIIEISIPHDIHFTLQQIYLTSCPHDQIDILQNTHVLEGGNDYSGTLDIRDFSNNMSEIDFYIDDWHFYG